MILRGWGDPPGFSPPPPLPDASVPGGSAPRPPYRPERPRPQAPDGLVVRARAARPAAGSFSARPAFEDEPFGRRRGSRGRQPLGGGPGAEPRGMGRVGAAGARGTRVKRPVPPEPSA
ncbi:hypothetical protein GFH48_28600 [Streptomyces fagopyri]|uniref:Uncharacterized protein n=1 Tax=Streptomyces fagopyri TaxID=2662397 RepID=A0A5Q0LIU2_9ACTN|nr:hypothetical protein GFH48_28600 [Streptomyces fagopyri]